MAELFDSDDGSISDEDATPGDGIKKRPKSPSETGNGEISEAPKKKFRALLDLEAEESGEDGEDEPDALEQEEHENDYVYDEFVVREESDSEETSSAPKPKKTLQRLKRAKPRVVEEEDLELLRDNEAQEVERSYDEIAPESFRDEDNKIEEENEQEGRGDDQTGTSSKNASRRYSRYEDDYESDDLDFVVDDEDDDGNEGAVRDEVEDPEERKRKRREREERFRGNIIGGPLREQLEEAAALFGEGYEDYLEEDEDEDDEDVFGDIAAEKELKKLQMLRSRFERSTLVESFCTDMDEVIRNTDRPERMIDIMVGRQVPDEKERLDEATWMSEKLAEKILFQQYELYLDPRELTESLVEPIQYVLQILQEEQREVPFIWTHRRDYLHHTMTRPHLWWIQSMDEKWENIITKRNRILRDLQYIQDTGSASDSGKSDQITLNECQDRVNEKRDQYQLALQDLENAQKELQIATNLQDEDEDDEDNLGFQNADSERILSAEKKILELKEVLELFKSDLEEEEARLTDLIRTKKSSRASCSKDVAVTFLSLFPIERYRSMLLSLRDEAEIRDFQQYFSVIFKGCVEECSGENGEKTKSKRESGRKKLRRGAEKDNYYLARKSPALRKLMGMFLAPVADIGDAMRFGSNLKVNPPTPYFDHQSLPEEYLSDSFPTSEKAVDAVKCMLATELASEPSIRHALREKFISTASISTKPTELGIENINPFSELFGVHFLKQKPLKDFLTGTTSDRYLYARLARAKSEGLLEIQINYPTIETPFGLRPDLDTYLNSTGLLNIVLPNEQDDWNVVRMTILGDMLEKHLLPALKEEVHRELLRVSVDTLVEQCAINFRKMLGVGPFRPSDVTPAQVLLRCPLRPSYPSVASVYLPAHSREAAMFLAFTDRDGVLRAHDLLPGEVRNQKKTKIKEFLKMTRPDVVVINTGAGQASQSTKLMIEKYIIQEVRQSLEEDLAKKRQEREDEMDYNRYEDEDEIVQFHPDIILMNDEVPRIFGESTRAKKLLPELLPGAASAVCLCRFVQDPLTEYANMWSSADALGNFGHEILFLDLHPHKSLITKAKVPLLRALESCLVDSVCDVGVDVNMAVSHDHLSGPLAFVGGLGLRKADALRHNIKTILGCVSSRKELLERKLMGKIVYNNAASFLRVCDQGLEDKAVDFFDDTRIHPECYIQNDFAPKICATAMDLPHSENYQKTVETVAMLRKNCRKELETTLKKPNSKFLSAWCRNELIDLPDKLSKLQLAQYAEELEAAGKGKRLQQFETIIREIRFPWLDMRPPLREPETNELFNLISGESDYSLYAGLRVGCKIIETRGNAVTLVIDNGLRGFARISNIADERIDDVSAVLRVGDEVSGVILRVIKDQIKVEVTLKPSDVSRTEDYWLSNRNTLAPMLEWWEQVERGQFDLYFNEEEALRAYQKNYKKRIDEAARAVESVLASDLSLQSAGGHQGGPGRLVRKIYHPLFKNLNSKEAEEYLKDKGPGEIIIRPSSKDKDTLIITWAFQENWYKHIEVKEENKASGGGDTIGQSLFISGVSDCFSDLDEISARYIAPMNDLVSQMISYRSFRRGSKEDIENWLNTELKARPNRIPYCIRFYEKQPGYFVLAWLLNVGHSVKSEIVAVVPEGYKMRDKIFGSPSELIQWFKSNATKKKEQQAHAPHGADGHIQPSRLPGSNRPRPPPPPPPGPGGYGKFPPPPPPKRASRFSDA